MIKKDIDMSLFRLLACERFLDEGINEINNTPDRKFWLITKGHKTGRGIRRNVSALCATDLNKL